jgi:hypothetical protein
MFARSDNPLRDYSKTDIKLLSPEELTAQNHRMVTVVYPELAVKADNARLKMAAAADNKRHMVADILPGSKVMLRDESSASKVGHTGAPWQGPFIVIGISSQGAYSLLSSSNQLLRRKVPRDKLRLVAGPVEDLVDNEDGDVFTAERIQEHKGSGADRRYKIRWRGYDESQDTWEPESNLLDKTLLDEYKATLPPDPPNDIG